MIATIKKSKDKDDAHKNLVAQFKFSDLQATAILEMRLQTLAALERSKIEEELKEKQKLITELTLLVEESREDGEGRKGRAERRLRKSSATSAGRRWLPAA